jgi:hypothetical protein
VKREKNREAARRWIKENPKKHLENVRQWQKENPDKHRENARRWQKENPDKVRESVRRWQKANPEKVRERVRRWMKANPDKVRERGRKNAQKRRANKEDAPKGFIPKSVFPLLKIVQDGKCYSCGRSLPKRGGCHLDHIKALKNGGADALYNLAAQCRSCGSSKHKSDVAEWMAEKYPNRSWNDIQKHLHIGYMFIWHYCYQHPEFNFEKDKKEFISAWKANIQKQNIVFS